MSKPSLFTALAVSLGLILSGCSTSSSPADSTNAVAIAESYDAIIDVRTEQEWQGGHLKDAVLISVESLEFIDQVSMLDKTGDYFIYCRSGNRAGVAIDMMRELGFTGELVNGGSVSAASQTLSMTIVQ